MESNWRMAISQLGLTRGPWELAASILGAPGQYLVKQADPPYEGTTIILNIQPDGTLGWTLTGYRFVGHFPYGFEAFITPD